MVSWSLYREKAVKAKVLIVGAGGIGCELIKNLVLAGFVNLVVVNKRTLHWL
jgi:ubiquitin-like 1-activating enzyme E1 B